MAQGLSKQERLCSVTAIGSLMAKGRYVSRGCLRCCFLTRESDVSRMLVSVPKRNFKRAVKRNLLKRRIRESYRLQKELLPEGVTVDMMFIYTAKEVLPYDEIFLAMQQILSVIGRGNAGK